MEVRKFEAFSMQDAIKLVKKELGKDAVILSTREKISEPGLHDGRTNKVYEVVAARGSSTGSQAMGHSMAAVGTQANGTQSNGTQGNGTRASGTQSGLGRTYVQGASQAQAVQFPRIRTQDEATVVKSSPTLGTLNNTTRQRASGAALGAASGGLQSLGTMMGSGAGGTPATGESPGAAAARMKARERLLDPVPKNQGSATAAAGHDLMDLKDEIQRVRRELETLPHVNVNEQIQEIKVLLHDLMRNRYQSDHKQFNEVLTDLGIRLRAGGVSEGYLAELLQTLAGLPIIKSNDGASVTGDMLKEFYLNQAIRQMFRTLHVTGPWSFDGRPRIVCLAGPTGVGKTTTIAKLAARFKLSENRKVAFVSMDSFRVAASDQLRVYSKILDCPFAEAADVKELSEFVQKNFDSDVIFIDTAGRSSRYLEQMQTLRALRGLELPLQFHLVLASTMKQRDLDENINAFKFLSPESLIFTKLDESWSFGEILNSTVNGRVPLSYFTTGQRVPEDLEIATKERIIERLFRL